VGDTQRSHERTGGRARNNRSNQAVQTSLYWLLVRDMNTTVCQSDFEAFDLDIARTRVALSLLAMLSLYIDPTAGGLFHLPSPILITLLCHLTYSISSYFALAHRLAPNWMSPLTIALDLVFATAIAYLTEGGTSPSYVFFVFAIIAVGVRTRWQGTVWITLAGVTFYLIVVALSGQIAGYYVMRAVYLGIAGCLVGFFGQQRRLYELRLRELEAQAERRTIARSLHDSYMQALAGVNLRLETCRELMRRRHFQNAATQIDELQIGVAREYDQVRAYVQSLAGNDDSSPRPPTKTEHNPTVELNAAITASSRLTEKTLLIALEGLRNARSHANARTIAIDARITDQHLYIDIRDDGVGFPPHAEPPWTIASYVAEAGGVVRIGDTHRAELKIVLPVLH
jgi:signal transduction histidine kinase